MGSISPQRGPAVTPVNYRLSIFDLKFAPEWQFSGSVVIEARVARPITEVVLHAAALDITTTELSQGSEDTTQICKAMNVSGGTDGAIRLCFSTPLEPGVVHIRISYRASIGNTMVGFFRARYRASTSTKLRDGDSAVVLATHFEPCHARFAFPCFDEPHLKATFDVEIEVPHGLTALGNMPVKRTTKLSGPKHDGLERVEFATTPVMSTYLLAWVIGEFEYVEAFTERRHGGIRVPVRVYTPPGLSKYASLALECARKVLDLFQELFGVDYPIPKSDHVVVPEFVSGAMENWGVITYKPTKILFDPATSNNRVMSKAAYVVAHELAHQWFGNLVTMNSWSALYLNEGFATWAGYMAVDHLFPEWDIWGQYVAEVMDDVMRLDSLPTTHAIETRVQDENEALQMFDQISYFKAASIIRMLAGQIGQDAFLEGLSRYLRRHAYKNARSQDLWDALSEVTGRDVPGVMGSWIHTCGYPVVRVRVLHRQGHEEERVEQRSVLSPGAAESNTGSWKLSLASSGAEKNGFGLVYRVDESVQSSGADTPLVLNRAHVGYFCVDYDQPALDSIARSLPVLSSADLAGVIVDLGNLATNCLKPTSELLDFLWKLRDTRDGFAWLSISRSLAFIRSVFSDDETVLLGLKAYTAALIRGVKHDVHCSTLDSMAYPEIELNKSVVSMAFACGDENSEPIIQEARRCFSKWAAGDAGVLPPNMRAVILSGCLATGSRADFEAVKAAFASDTSLDGPEVLLAAMGSVSDPALAYEALDFAFDSDAHVALQHLHLLGRTMGQNNACRAAQWAYVQSRWLAVSRRLGANAVCRDKWIEESMCRFSDAALGEEICNFLARHCGPAVSKPLDNVRANIRRNAAYREWAREDILQWLASRALSP